MEKQRVIKNNKLLKNAKELRQQMTIQERHLWYDFLRNRPYKVYRQRIIDNYIADFYCSAARLVIEIDGNQHQNDEIYKYDKERTRIINMYGIKVIRFSNKDVDERFEAVCTVIDNEIKNRIELL